MKKLFLPVIALAMFASSCQKDDSFNANSNLKLDLPSEANRGSRTSASDGFYDANRGQTPINIVTENTIEYSSMDPVFHYTALTGTSASAKTHYSVDPNADILTAFDEYNLKVSVNGNALGNPTPTIGNNQVYITINGEKYYLIQYHFHYDSEHELNGKRFDMEVHLVHQAMTGKVAVVGVFIKKGHEKTKTLEEIFNTAPEEETDLEHKVTISGFNPKSLLPENKEEYFTYSGSLTTPAGLFNNSTVPYVEGLRWFVFAKPITVSEESYDHYTEVYEHPNARPIQALGNRKVLAHDGDK